MAVFFYIKTHIGRNIRKTGEIIMKRKVCSSAVITIAIICCVISLLSVVTIGLYRSPFGVDALQINETTVYIGGEPIGISAQSEYFIVSELINVNTHEGSYSPAKRSGIVKGDIVYSLNGKRVTDIVEFNDEIQKSEKAVIIVKRGNNFINCEVKPVFDAVQNAYKVGMLLKNNITGIGTMTFVTKDGYFAALGHAICDEFGHSAAYNGGNIYACEVTGYNKTEVNRPGELRGNVDFNMVTGGINKNCIAGIYGKTIGNNYNTTEIQVASKDEVVAGKAEILTTIDGKEPKFYEIEIIKAVNQNSLADKSMVIRVTDKELKESTGGILQGMSGSPIIQNGKLVGAVTHVFISDSTKGYGIYAEWMLESIKS